MNLAQVVVSRRVRGRRGSGGRRLVRVVAQRGVNAVAGVQLHDLPAAIAQSHGVQAVRTDGVVDAEVRGGHRLHGQAHRSTRGTGGAVSGARPRVRTNERITKGSTFFVAGRRTD